MTVHFVPTIFFGDAKQQDLMACRYSSYKNSTRIARWCKTHYWNADNTAVVCVPITINEVKNLFEKTTRSYQFETTRNTAEQRSIQQQAARELQELNCHQCENALWNLDTGNGNQLPLPHDCMHLFSGVYQKMLEIFFLPLSL